MFSERVANGGWIPVDKSAGAGKVHLGADTLSLNLLGMVQNLI